MAVRAVRGAVQPGGDEAGHRDRRAGAPLTALPGRGGRSAGAPTGSRLPAAPGPRRALPATAARGPGTAAEPPVRSREVWAAGGPFRARPPAAVRALPRAVRPPAPAGSGRPRAGTHHVYLGAAQALRKDVAQ